ncbi:MAG TPA: hypothetical protein VFM31_01440 [Nitrososphaeraceae archaeon]|nr:hypothetical protein [Nitrososphaeraceae archaeon]
MSSYDKNFGYFMTSSRINYQALADIHPEFEEECTFQKKLQKMYS